jgi:heterodisulfide reductase subunit A2
MSTLVMFETFGDTLKERLDVDALENYTKKIEGIYGTCQIPLLNQKVMLDKLVEVKLNGGKDVSRVVAVTGSRVRLEKPLQRAMENAGLDPNQLVITNVREQCALVHEKAEATEKAKRLIRIAVEKARLSTPLERKVVQRFNEVLVIGGGVSGIQASLDLSKLGVMVHLVEREPTIGGMMPLLGKTFPEDSCAICIGGPKMMDVGNEQNIEVLDNSEVEAVIKMPVGYRVHIRRKPRYVDSEKCVACGQCTERCPVSVPDHINGGISKRKAVYLPHPNAIPRKHIIDPETCLFLTKGSCRLCERVCPNQAINFKDEVKFKDLYVGSIIVATGVDNWDAHKHSKYGAQYKDVIDQFQLARYLDGEGPTAGILTKPSDGQKPKKIVMIQCAGSRDPEINPWCSRYCCMAAMKHAEEIKLHQGADIDITILYKDIRAGGKFYEEFYNRVKTVGINFVHGNLDAVREAEKGELIVEYTDGKGQKVSTLSDLVVLSTGMVPSKGTLDLAERLGVELGGDGFFKEIDAKVASTITKRPGIYLAGACHSPKDIPESVAQASAAAAMAGLHLMKEVDANRAMLTPNVDSARCGRCGVCPTVCPYQAISMPAEGPVRIDELLCQSCGLCISSCPTRALDNPNFGFDLVDAQVKTALEGGEKSLKIVGFACNDCGYRLLDIAGVTGAKYSSSFIPIYVPCMSTISLRHVIGALDHGADGVMLIGCVKDRCHFDKGVEHAEGQLRFMENLYGEKEMPIRVLKSCGSMLEQFLTELGGLVDQIEEARK